MLRELLEARGGCYQKFTSSRITGRGMWFREDNPALKHWRNKLGAALNRVSQPGVIRMAQEPLENGVPQLGQQPPPPKLLCDSPPAEAAPLAYGLGYLISGTTAGLGNTVILLGWIC